MTDGQSEVSYMGLWVDSVARQIHASRMLSDRPVMIKIAQNHCLGIHDTR